MNKRKFEDDATSTDTKVSIEKKILSRFISDTGEVLPCGEIHLPNNTTVNELRKMCNAFLQPEDPLLFAFYINNVEVTDTLEKYLKDDFNLFEDIVEIVYQPQALFKIKAVTRCTGSLEGLFAQLCYI